MSLLVKDVYWTIFDYVTDGLTIQNLSYCSKDLLNMVQAYFRGRYVATSRKCNACNVTVGLDQQNSACNYHSGVSKPYVILLIRFSINPSSWMDFYDDPVDGWRFTGTSYWNCCGRSSTPYCQHAASHTFDKAKCKNCGALFSIRNKKGKNIYSSIHHTGCYACCQNTNICSPGCTFAEEHVAESVPGVIDRFVSFWSKSGRKCVTSSPEGSLVFKYSPKLNRWTQTHFLNCYVGSSPPAPYGLLTTNLEEPFSPNGLFLVVRKQRNHFIYDLAGKKMIGPFCTHGDILGYTWTSDSRHLVYLFKDQQDHGPISFHAYNVQAQKMLQIRTFTPSIASFSSAELRSAYFIPAASEPSTTSCRHPDLKDFAKTWLERDAYIFFEPHGDRFLMVNSWGNFSLYRFAIKDSNIELKHLKYRSSFIPKGCSPPIRTVEWIKDKIMIFSERNPRGRACEPQFYFDIYEVNNNLDSKVSVLDPAICDSKAGDVILFKFDSQRNIYYYAQHKVLHVIDASFKELWSVPLPEGLPEWAQMQLNVRSRILLSGHQGVMLSLPETKPEQPIEEENLFAQFFNSANCYVEK